MNHSPSEVLLFEDDLFNRIKTSQREVSNFSASP
ncbi:unnamed protein product, partial [Rotaria magnacalcarata]